MVPYPQFKISRVMHYSHEERQAGGLVKGRGPYLSLCVLGSARNRDDWASVTVTKLY